MEVYVVTEEYGSPWTGHCTIIHKAFANEDAANKYAVDTKPLYDGILDVIPTELD